MPSVTENRAKWSDHAWTREGHEWSPGGSRAGTEQLWLRTIRPRIQSCVPARHVLEIAPGFGRWTSRLLGECERLVAVDVTQRCVDVCRKRFAGAPADFWVNDGESLPMLGGDSIDFAFSFDSLVHVEAPQIRAYLRELRRVLRPGGLGFIHHSNLGAYAGRAGAVPSYVTRRHWRAPSVSARLFRLWCREAGLVCLTQEVINWIGRGARSDRHRLPGEYIPLTDCFSLFVRSDRMSAQGVTRVFVNRRFVDEWRQLVLFSKLYAPSGLDAHVEPEKAAGGRPAATALRQAVRRSGWAGMARAAAERLVAVSEPRISRVRESAIGRWYAMRKTATRRIAAGVCPDCVAPLQRTAAGPACSACEIMLVGV